MSDKMLKYIIGSCFKKMKRRAFYWASCFMIGSLTAVDLVHVPTTLSTAKPDHKLSTFLGSTTKDTNKQTFAQWVMTYHPSKSLAELPSVDDFLTFTGGHSNYQFDHNVATTFHSLLLSSLYAYLCLAMQLHCSMEQHKKQEPEAKKIIPGYVGSFCNAIRILYLLSHSNAMKAYFTFVKLPIVRPSSAIALYYQHQVLRAVHDKLGWPLPSVDMPKANDDGDEDSDPQDSCVEYFKENDVQSIYRRSFMSFVDHYAALRLLERRAVYLQPDETIKLSLVAVKHPKTYYFPWEEMEAVIHKTCQDFNYYTQSR